MTHTETLQIEGMSCGHCVRAVRTALEGVPGVTVDDVQVGRADVRYDAASVPRERLVQAVEEEGFGVSA